MISFSIFAHSFWTYLLVLMTAALCLDPCLPCYPLSLLYLKLRNQISDMLQFFLSRLCLGSILCVSGILLAPAVFLSLSKLLLFPHHLVSLTGFNSHSLSHSLHLPIHPFCFFYPSLTFNLSPPSHGVLWCVIAARASYSSL